MLLLLLLLLLLTAAAPFLEAEQGTAHTAEAAAEPAEHQQKPAAFRRGGGVH